MSETEIPQAILYDALREAINGRRVKAGVFLTFQFDPGFFEEEILTILFDQSLSHVPKIRLVQLEEALRGVNHMAVYYDRRGLTADAQPSRLDYRRIGLARPTGYFHPKNILLLLENQSSTGSRDSLLIATLSANLTRAGWWENVEVAHLEEVHEGDKCPFRQDLLDLMARVRQEDRTGEAHAALDEIHSFLLQHTTESHWRKRRGRWLPRLYVGRVSVPEFLQAFVQPGHFYMEIISPYFDTDESATTLRSLLDTLKPKATRVFLPEGKDGAALCGEDFFDAVRQMRDVIWGRLPSELLRLSTSDQHAAASRFVHAKVYRFWNEEREIFFVGSANLTRPAHQPGHAGNFETGILVESAPRSQPDWWLQAPQETRPDTFRGDDAEATDVDGAVGNLSLRFDWQGHKLDYFWEAAPGPNPRSAVVNAQGVSKFRIEPIRFGAWVALPAEYAGQIEELLKSTSFVEVSVDGGEPFRVLIREEGMAHKPSLLLELTAEEILQYWSLLSPEQREAFLADKRPDLVDGTAYDGRRSDQPTRHTMFDRFVGIFHAFGRLERHVCDALHQGRETEAVYRLFGQKYDSLPSLVQRVVEDEEGDRVNRYVTLLCARQILDRIKATEADFARRHAGEFQSVYEQLGAVDQMREGFVFATPAERERFFDWFERMFFLEIPIPEQEPAS